MACECRVPQSLVGLRRFGIKGADCLGNQDPELLMGLVHVAVGHVASDEVQDLSRTNRSSQPPPATPP